MKNINIAQLTWNRAPSDQSPNQFKTHRLNKAGDVAALSLSPSEDGFMVNTTCRFLITRPVNHLYNSSLQSSLSPSRCAHFLHWVIKVAYSSPGKDVKVNHKIKKKQTPFYGATHKASKNSITFKKPRNFSIGKKSIHSFQETRIENIWFIKDESNFFILAAWTS